MNVEVVIDVIVCDICGDVRHGHLLAICSRCMDGVEHTYCMKKMQNEVPKHGGLCEECKNGEGYDLANHNGIVQMQPVLRQSNKSSNAKTVQ